MRDCLLTVHGIWTKGPWQEEVARIFAPHFDCISIKYPQYRWLGPVNLLLEPYVVVVLGLLLVVLRKWITADRAWDPVIVCSLIAAYSMTFLRRTRAFKTILANTSPYASRFHQSHTHVIAHSLGTYLIGRALRTRSDFHLGRIVLVGCVLPRAFAWSTLRAVGVSKTSRFLAVRNEVARKDIVVCMAWSMSWLIYGLGIAGFLGFKGPPELVHKVESPAQPCTQCHKQMAIVHNVVSRDLGHSDTFVGSGYAETFWLPFLWGIEPAEYHDFIQYCKLAGGLEREWSSKARAAGYIDPRLVKVENEFRRKSWQWCSGSFGAYVEQEVHSRYPVSGEPLNQSVSLAVRGTWQSVVLALEAWQVREERFRDGLPGDSEMEGRIAWLNPRKAVRRAVALLL